MQNNVQRQKIIALGEMASGLAHEINNPLAIIIGTLYVLENEVTSDSFDAAEAVKTMHRLQAVAQRIAKIVSGIRSFAGDYSNEKKHVVHVGFIVEDALSFCREKILAGGIKLMIEDETGNALINVQVVQIVQVILSLLSNAYDAILPLELEDKSIHLKTFVDGKDLVVRVKDSGPGVPPEIADRIMQPFFSTKQTGQGTGLGLSVALGIATANQGSLALNPSVHPSCFELRLPFTKMSY
jgi:C4-dicarboxylate-specific signal transduction histidine kinase